ncbi:MAG: tRNA 2-selenouridine(34) synthase MnmH [Sediminibacterium sp.]|jgi:tRNA 2-selenouridine synthase|nr:tRNA 2-selenouridine(34) synthase MnmH [Sediminibacterium sp.]
MPFQSVSWETFIAKSHTWPVIDVRSPNEYTHAHIPFAYSLPIFNNEERHEIGLTYKQKSSSKAIQIGLDYFGPKMKSFVLQAEQLFASNNELLIYCWRGGMRSEAMCWLLGLYGWKVYQLEGGYKSFRSWVLQQFQQSYPLIVLGGYTGSSKTELLHQLSNAGEVVVDLEQIAGHKGSAFGNLGLPPQESAEQFENKLALALHHAERHRILNHKKWIWVEGESQRIGQLNIPSAVYQQMKSAPNLFLYVPFDERLEKVVTEYGNHEKEALVHAVMRIRKRLGGLYTKEVVNFLLENKVQSAFHILLSYYDRFYDRSSKDGVSSTYEIRVDEIPFRDRAAYLIDWVQKNI